MSSGLQDDGIKESERPFVERGASEHNTRHRLERLESFAFLKEFSGISYQTHRGEGARRVLEISHWDSLQNGGRAGKFSEFHFVK